MQTVTLIHPLITAPTLLGDFSRHYLPPGTYPVRRTRRRGGDRWVQVAATGPFGGQPWIVLESPTGKLWATLSSDPPPATEGDAHPYTAGQVLAAMDAGGITRPEAPWFLVMIQNGTFDTFDDWVGYMSLEGRKWILWLAEATLNPGLEVVEGRGRIPTNARGAAQLAAGLHSRVWARGYHREVKFGKRRPCLRQAHPTWIARLDEAGAPSSSALELAGLNIHGTNREIVRDHVGDWSHGCPVLRWPGDYGHLLGAAYAFLGDEAGARVSGVVIPVEWIQRVVEPPTPARCAALHTSDPTPTPTPTEEPAMPIPPAALTAIRVTAKVLGHIRRVAVAVRPEIEAALADGQVDLLEAEEIGAAVGAALDGEIKGLDIFSDDARRSMVQHIGAAVAVGTADLRGG